MITEEQEKELQKGQVFQWVAVKAVAIDEGKLLLGKRLDETDNGLFEVPGGKLEIGESLSEALVREVQEEAGVKVEPLNLNEREGEPVFIGQTDKRSVTIIYFLAKVLDKTSMFKDSEELAEIGFYSKDEVGKFLEENLSRNCERTLLQKFVKGEFNVRTN